MILEPWQYTILVVEMFARKFTNSFFVFELFETHLAIFYFHEIATFYSPQRLQKLRCCWSTLWCLGRVQELVERGLKDIIEIIIGTRLLTSKLLTKDATEKVIHLQVLPISTVDLYRNGLHIWSAILDIWLLVVDYVYNLVEDVVVCIVRILLL